MYSGVSFIVAFGLNKKVSCEGLIDFEGLLGRRKLSILKHLYMYLNYNAEFSSKISYIMFVHDFLAWPCVYILCKNPSF